MLVEVCFYYLINKKQMYATLLNCWKFLKPFLSYQVENILMFSMAFMRVKEMVTNDGDITMDNQQPSPIQFFLFILFLIKYIYLKNHIGCRSQTKMAVGKTL